MKYRQLTAATYSTETHREIILPEDWKIQPAGVQHGHRWQNGLPVWENQLDPPAPCFYVDKVKEVTESSPRCFLIERKFYTYDPER